MTMEHPTTSLHLFHVYAALDRIDCTSLPDDIGVIDIVHMFDMNTEIRTYLLIIQHPFNKRKM